MAEQRANPRYAIELDAQLLLEGGRAVRGRTQDISRGGFCVLVPSDAEAVPLGARCGVLLALVFSESEFSEQLRLQATIAWSTKLKNQGVQLGVKFEPLDTQSKGYLDLFIRFLEDGRAAEGPEDDPGPGEP